MTGVIVHTDASAQYIRIRRCGEKPSEKCDGLTGILEVPQGLRLKAEVKITALGNGKIFDEIGTLDQMIKDPFFIRGKGLKRSRQAGYRSLFTNGNERGENAKKVQCVVEATALSPVRSIDLLLHPGIVKSTKGESVYGKNTTMMCRTPVLEFS